MSREDAILDLIVDAALEDRPFASLVEAYIDERLHDEDVPPFEGTQAMEQWMRKNLGMLYGNDEIERVLRPAYLRVYKRLAPWSTGESFEVPDDMPQMVPREVIFAVGEALGKQDAMDAVALRAARRA